MKLLNTENGCKKKLPPPNKIWYGSTTEKPKSPDKEKNSETTDVMPLSCSLKPWENTTKLWKLSDGWEKTSWESLPTITLKTNSFKSKTLPLNWPLILTCSMPKPWKLSTNWPKTKLKPLMPKPVNGTKMLTITLKVDWNCKEWEPELTIETLDKNYWTPSTN